MIRKAQKRDVKSVYLMYKELLVYEKEHISYSNWVLDVYPTKDTAEAGFRDGTLYVIEENGELCGSIILNSIQPDIYGSIHWEYKHNPEDILVVHTLCVPPSKAGKGYGKQLIDFAFKKAAEMGISAVRLDTFAKNEPAAALYRSSGFRYAGTAFSILNGVIPEMQIFFEKEIKEVIMPAANGADKVSALFNADSAA